MKRLFWLLSGIAMLLVVSCDGGKTEAKDDAALGDGDTVTDTDEAEDTLIPSDGDNLESPDEDVVYTISGFVQKGPFVKNSQIDIQELDNTLVPTGKSYNTQTEDDLGGFDLPSKLTERYAEIKASGYYFNEITGAVSASTLTFNVLADLSLGEKTNINILTTLARPRIKFLISDEGKTFSEARVQAETEVLKAFYIEEEGVSSFQEMDISQQGTSNAILLAISAILQADNTEGTLSQLLGDIMDELEEDGTIDDTSIKEEIAANGQYVGAMLETIRTNIETYYEELDTAVTVPAFEDFCDDDGDTVINKYDFTLDFTPVTEADLAAEHISNEITVVLPPSATTADATVTGGTLVVNGIDLGETTAEVVAGDLVAVKVIASSELGTATEGILSITYAGIYRPAQENTGTFSVTTRVEPYFATDQILEQWPGVAVQSEPATVSLPVDLESADIAITEGRLFINDTESGQSGTVENGDTVAVRLTTGPTHGDEVSSTITITHGSFAIGEGTVVAKTNRTKQWGSTNSDYGRTVAVDGDGNLFVTGYAGGAIGDNTYLGGGDIFLTKWTPDGATAWTRQWGTEKAESGNSVAVDGDGNIFVTGGTEGALDGNANAGNNDIFLTKWNADGTKALTKLWGNASVNTGLAVAVDGDGNIFVVGESTGSLDGNPSANGWDAFITKWNADGTKAWTKLWGTNGGDTAEGVVVDKNGAIFVTGNTEGNLDGNTGAGGYDIFLTKWNADGTKAWTKQWGTTHQDIGFSVAIDGDGNIFVVGESSESLDGNLNQNPGTPDAFLTKWNADGTKAWTKLWGTNGGDTAEGVVVDENGNIFVAGYTAGFFDGFSNAGDYDLFLTKWNSDGTEVWTEQWGSTSDDRVYGLAAGGEGYIFVSGVAGNSLDGNTGDGEYDAFLTKFPVE